MRTTTQWKSIIANTLNSYPLQFRVEYKMVLSKFRFDNSIMDIEIIHSKMDIHNSIGGINNSIMTNDGYP